MNTQSDKRKILYRMLFTALFIALVFAGTNILIPTGISQIHLGNLVMIIAGLLMGPWIGGISGSVGMTIFDLMKGYGPDTWVRTFIVKFIAGFLAGLIFRVLVKKKKDIKWVYILMILIFAVMFVTMMTLYILFGQTFQIGSRTFKNSLFLVISLGLITLLFTALFILSSKIKTLEKYVLLTTSIAVVINIILEFSIKIPFKMAFAQMNFDAAFTYALVSLPSAIMTGIITIGFVTFIYCPIYFATARVNKLNDLYNEIQEITGGERR